MAAKVLHSSKEGRREQRTTVTIRTLLGRTTKNRIQITLIETIEEISTHCDNIGLYSYFMDSMDDLKEEFLKVSTDDSKEHIDEDDGIETDLTPLHLAVLNNASPDAIGSLLNANSFCLNLRTSKGRTAMDIAKATPGAEGSIEVMQSYEKNVSMLLRLSVVSKALIDASAEDSLKGELKLNDVEAESEEEVREKKDPKMLWKKGTTAVKFLNRLTLSLGPTNEMDCDEAMIAPPTYEPPANLDMVCVDITLPVGFRQLRRGLTNSKSTFCKDFHVGKMNYSELDIGAWDKFDNKIGIVKGNAPMDEQKFIGAKREINYLMPASLMVKANTAYTTETILEYTNYSLVIQRVAKNPDVPYGKTFECQCLDVFINTGHNTVRMITSTQAVFYKSPPFIAWKIKGAMKNGVTEKSIALGESICDIRAQSIKFTEANIGGEFSVND